MTRARHLLGWALVVASVLAVVVVVGCAPDEEPPHPTDNIWCNFEGYAEKAVRGRLRTSFDYRGGDCVCDCTGVPVDLECTITATGAR